MHARELPDAAVEAGVDTIHEGAPDRPTTLAEDAVV